MKAPLDQWIWSYLKNVNRLTDRIPTALTEPSSDRLPTDLTAYADLTELLENILSRLDVGELTDLTNPVG